MSRCYGRIKTINVDKGYSFLAADHGVDAFSHAKDYERAGLAWPPKIGDRFSFDVEENPKGLRATNIAGAA